MNKYYFTFGSNEQFPYGREQYVVVFAVNMQDAVNLYREKYPDLSPGIVNCTFYYPQSEWAEVSKAFPFPPAEVINGPETKDILRELAEQLVDECKTFALDSISLQVKPNGQVLAVAEYKDTDGKQTFTRVTRRDKSKPFMIM